MAFSPACTLRRTQKGSERQPYLSQGPLPVNAALNKGGPNARGSRSSLKELPVPGR